MAWDVVEFSDDEVDPGRPTSMYQFRFDLLCAEVFQEEDTNLWLGAVIDADGCEVWLSPAAGDSYEARRLVVAHVRECFANWLNEMAQDVL